MRVKARIPILLLSDALEVIAVGQRWQYLNRVFEGWKLQGELDELGEAGWELITAHWEEFSYGGRTQQQARCILKRLRDTGDDVADENDEYSERWEAAPLGRG